MEGGNLTLMDGGKGDKIEVTAELLKVASAQAALGATSPAVEPHLRP